jgi:hypothetical protein
MPLDIGVKTGRDAHPYPVEKGGPTERQRDQITSMQEVMEALRLVHQARGLPDYLINQNTNIASERGKYWRQAD